MSENNLEEIVSHDDQKLVSDDCASFVLSTYKFRAIKITKFKPIGKRKKEIPKARSGHRIVANSGDVYSFGGYNPCLDDPLLKELWKFNLSSKCWEKIETVGQMPDLVASHSVVLVNNSLVVFGGSGFPFGVARSNKTFVCDLKNLTWSTLATTGTPPSKQYGQASTVYDNKLYIVGGTDGRNFTMRVHCLNLETKEWVSLDDDCDVTPEPRYRHEIAIDDDQLFVFGGGTCEMSYGFKEIPIFSLLDNTWKFCPCDGDVPAPRQCHGCVQSGKEVFICGGYNGERIFDDIWKINLGTLQWTKLPVTLPRSVYFHSTAISPEGQMFIFGGVTNIQNSTRTREMYTVWLKVPSLAELCWQAGLYYCPYLVEMDKKKLLEAGIPRMYMNRIS